MKKITLLLLLSAALLCVGATIKISQFNEKLTLADTNLFELSVPGDPSGTGSWRIAYGTLRTNLAVGTSNGLLTTINDSIIETSNGLYLVETTRHAAFVRTNDTNVSFFGSLSVHPAAPGTPSGLSLSETSQVHSVTYQGANVIQTNVVILSVSNATSGVKVWQPAGIGTNGDVALPLAVGQSVTWNGSAYVAGPLSLTVTDTNSVTIDFAGPYSSYVVPVLATNFTVSLTNTYGAFAGRSISVEFPTNITTSALQITNAAAQAVRYSPNATTNGYPAILKTNTTHFSLVFTMPSTNYPIADFSFYR